MGFWKQFSLIVRKNFTLSRRQPLRVTIEVIWPLVLFVILAAVRTRPNLMVNQPECHFEAKAMPSAGLLPFLRGIICTSNNTCYQEQRDSENGLVNNSLIYVLNQVIDETTGVLANSTVQEMLKQGVAEIPKVANVIKWLQNGGAVGPIGHYLLVGTPEILRTLNARGVYLSESALDAILRNASVSLNAFREALQYLPQMGPLTAATLELRKAAAYGSSWIDALGTTVATLNNNGSLQGNSTLTDIFGSIVAALNNSYAGGRDYIGILGQSTLADVVGTLMATLGRSYTIATYNRSSGSNGTLADVLSATLADMLSTPGVVSLNSSYSNGLGNKSALGNSAIMASLNSSYLPGVNNSGLLYNNNLRDGPVFSQQLPAALRALTEAFSIFPSAQGGLGSLGNLSYVVPNIKNLFCGGSRGVMKFSPPSAADLALPALCNLTQAQLLILSSVIVSNINASLLLNDLLAVLPDEQVFVGLAKVFEEVAQLPAIHSVFENRSELLKNVFSEVFCLNSSSTGWISYLSPPDTVDWTTPAFSNENETSNITNPMYWVDTPAVSANDSGKSTLGFCSSLLLPLQDSQVGRIVSRQIEPLLFGKIPYAPSSPRIDEIVRNANSTFQMIADITALTSLFANALWQLSGNLETFVVVLDAAANLVNATASFNPNAHMEAAALRALAAQLQPNGTIASELVTVSRMSSVLASYLGCFETNKFEPLPDEATLVNRSLLLIDSNRYWAALVFNSSYDGYPNSTSSLPAHISYKIRMNTDKVDSTRRIEDRYWKPRPRSNPFSDLKYITYGFAYIQDMIEHAFINLHAGKTSGSALATGIYLQQFPYPCYIQDNFASAVSRTMPLFMVLAWLFSVAMIVKGVVYEKQERLKEAMKIMGLTQMAHWSAWFASSLVIMTASVILLVLLVKYGSVVEESDPSVVFVFMMCFVVATVSQSFLLSAFFSRANLAACCAALIFFCLYLPYTLLAQWEEVLSTNEKALSCLLSSVAFGFGCSYLSRYEEQGTGMQWSNIATSPIADDGFSMARCMGMMLLDSVIYLALLWYIETAFPGKYGVPKPWYFPFTRSYWCGTQRRAFGRSATGRSGTYVVGHADQTRQPDSAEQELCVDGTLGVSIRGLRKVYTTGKKVAVDGLSLDFYEDQITSFLGHNGAGKTTTMSILCGLFPPSDGTAAVYGLDIVEDMDEIRKSLGFCPQHNILFDDLTVEEHVLFYAQLKGERIENAREELEAMLHEVGLKAKQYELAKSLSGGMKRKLSVMMSFVGGSKCVILDEPTAGVDPYSRRQIWELLLKFKRGRTVILSTHHMDEADFLGDRIAIISQGKLCCVGSSLFLKSRYGSGYYLTIILKDNAVSAQTGGASQADSVFKFVTERIPDAQLMAEHRGELCVQLPSEGARDGSFERLFRDLDKSSDELGISTYGVSDTTLEEIFLKVAEDSGLDLEESLVKLTDGGQLPQPPSRFSFRSRGRVLLRKLKATLSSTQQRRRSRHMQLNGLPETGRGQPEEHPVVPTFSVFRHPPSATNVRHSLATNPDTGNVCSQRIEMVNPQLNGGPLSDAIAAPSLALPQPEEFSVPVEKEVDSTSSTYYSSSSHSTYYSSSSHRTLAGGDVSDSDSGLPRDRNASNGLKAQALSTSHMTSTYRLQGVQLWMQQFRALVIKRFHHVRRSKKALFCEILLPAAFITLALTFALILPPIEDEPPLELQPWMYEPRVGDPHLTAFYGNKAGTADFASAFESLVREGLYGTRCMNSAVYSISGHPCNHYSDVAAANSWTQQLSAPPYKDLPTCSCDTGYQQCPANASGPPASSRLLNTTDYMLNMTARNVSDWLVKTMQPYIKRRYGGFTFEANSGSMSGINVSSIMNIIRTVAPQLSAAAFNQIRSVLQRTVASLGIQQVAKVWFDNKGWAASVSYMNAMNNVLLRAAVRARGLDPRLYGITAINHPMKMTDDQFVEATLNRGWISVVISICVIFAMSLIPATFVLYLIEDRTSTSKHLQFVSGMSRTTYWTSSFVWDMFNYAAAACVCLCIFAAFNEQAYVSPTNAPCLIVLLLFYGWAMIPLMYPFSFLFSVPSTAFVVLSCLNIFLGITTTIGTFILELFPDDPYLNEVGHTLRLVFLIFPHYCLGRGLIDMSVAHLKCQTMSKLGGGPCNYDPFSWTLTGRNIMCLAIVGCVCFALVLTIEYRASSECSAGCKPKVSGRRRSSTEEEEEDVHRERLRVLGGRAADDVLRVENAKKAYRTARGKTNVAVDGLTFGVRKAECFGLLGVNGAGKTTTFKMLTGETNFTGGNAFLSDHSVRTNISAVYENLGYCPQFDALDALLTGRQHLEFYARLRGMPEAEVGSIVQYCLKKMNLSKYKDKMAGSYSGGNKRKLQAAIALIGHPAAVFLDEPTTGMDPKARRFLWDCIKSLVKDGHAVVLTSHSMEECEALCQRIGIMVNGRFRCMGSAQHLKNKYGSGYVVSIRAANGSASAGELGVLKAAIRDRLGCQAELTEENRDTLHYRLANTGPAAADGVQLSLAALFASLELLRTEYQLEDYSVCQTSLDHVFVRFASHQADDGAENGLPDCKLAPADWDQSDRVSIADGGSLLSAAGSQINLVV